MSVPPSPPWPPTKKFAPNKTLIVWFNFIFLTAYKSQLFSFHLSANMFNRFVLKSLKLSPQMSKLCKQPINKFHVGSRNENMMIVGGAALLTGAVGAQYALKLYNSMPKSEQPSTTTDVNDESVKTDTETVKSFTEAKAPNAEDEKSMFSSWFAKNYYEGGFEDKMTKREAALILGIRESATGDRIKDAHRRILLLNHPDRGGSAYMAAKINEAKDMLIKGKQ